SAPLSVTGRLLSIRYDDIDGDLILIRKQGHLKELRVKSTMLEDNVHDILCSALVDDCIERAKSIKQGGDAPSENLLGLVSSLSR
ncbi:hypothetical protein AB0162_29780, partial [Klebsiella pneumoniae]